MCTPSLCVHTTPFIHSGSLLTPELHSLKVTILNEKYPMSGRCRAPLGVSSDFCSEIRSRKKVTACAPEAHLAFFDLAPGGERVVLSHVNVIFMICEWLNVAFCYHD